MRLYVGDRLAPSGQDVLPTPAPEPVPQPVPAPEPLPTPFPEPVPEALPGSDSGSQDWGRSYGLLPAEVGFLGAGVLLAAVPVLDRLLGARAGSVALVASWAADGALLFLGGWTALAAGAVLAWNALAFLVYRAAAPRRARRLSGVGALTVLAVLLADVHEDVEERSWRRRFTFRIISDQDDAGARFDLHAHAAAFYGLWFRRHTVHLTPRLEVLDGTPVRLSERGRRAGTRGALRAALAYDLVEHESGTDAKVAATVRLDVPHGGLSLSLGPVSASQQGVRDVLEHEVALGTFRFRSPAGGQGGQGGQGEPGEPMPMVAG